MTMMCAHCIKRDKIVRVSRFGPAPNDVTAFGFNIQLKSVDRPVTPYYYYNYYNNYSSDTSILHPRIKHTSPKKRYALISVLPAKDMAHKMLNSFTQIQLVKVFRVVFEGRPFVVSLCQKPFGTEQ